MSKECQKEIFRWLLVILIFYLIVFITILHLGDNEMIKFLTTCNVCKMLISIPLIAAFICIWCCKADYCKSSAQLAKTSRKCILGYDTGIAVIRNEENSYTVSHYDSIDKAFLNVKNNDILYIFNSEIKITEQELSVLYARRDDLKEISINFVKASSINTVKIKK